MHWLKGLKGQVRYKEPLAIHTTLGVGGPADLWVQPRDILELKKILYHGAREKLPFMIIGKGSNILFNDQGFRGMVVCLNSPAFSKIKSKGRLVFAGAGVGLSQLVTQTMLWGLGGLEFLAGIPGTLGGALVMNAGSAKESTASAVKTVIVLDRRGKKVILPAAEIKFSYRRSNLNRFVIVAAVLQLVKRGSSEIGRNISTFLTQKKKSQDLVSKSAGCIFKNPGNHLTAAKMIELCGLKGMRKGSAWISTKHANYIINRNGTKAADILYLIKVISGKVKKEFGVVLEPEIKIVS